MKDGWKYGWWAVAGLIGFGVIVSEMGGCEDSLDKDRDPFYTATKKLDSGNTNLTREERQRLEDIVNWCRECKKPLRRCPHG